jgi:RimJ/RimL family protein N-acetyltransferase
MFSNYPKKTTLKDDRQIILRPMKKEDETLLHDFFKRLSPEERNYLKQDVTDPAFIQRLIQKLDQEYYIMLLAIEDGVVIGEANLNRHRFGWARHVGEIRIITDPSHRQIGLGTALAKEIFFLAVKLKLDKVIAQMMEDQPEARRVFERLGFSEEAVLRGQVTDISGVKHNLLIMSQSILEMWERIQDLYEESVKVHSGK